jgi:peroxiredoxin
MKRLSLAFASLCIWAFAASAAAPEGERQPRAADPEEVVNFALLDFRGRYFELRRADAKVVVLFWTGNGCPIARQSVAKLRALRGKFAKQGAVFWMINSNPQDDRQSIAEEAGQFRVGSIPILRDDVQAVARTFGVKRTAEAIAISTKDWTIVYRGAIDDQLSEGAKKPSPTEKHLETALTEFFAGQPISRSRAAVSGCLIKFDSEGEAEAAPVSYAKEIAPLLQRKCVSCHSPGNIGPFAMSSYKKVKGWSEMMREVVVARRMPPWHADPLYGRFHNDRSLSPKETRTFLRWIEQGAPRGEGEDPLESAASTATADWPLGQPDFILRLPKPQTIPPTGVLSYRYIDAESPLTEDTWVRAAVVRPGNRKVVHHVILRIIYPDTYKDKFNQEYLFTSWAPGNTAPAFPEGTGKFIPKGSRFNFEMHYNTIGREEVDQSEVGFYALKEPPAMELKTLGVETRDFSIPPEEADARSFAVQGFKRETILYDLVPHMHLRGSWFKYEALYPDGTRETLLSVPNYDFNWQTEYRLAQPKRLPAGTWLLCTGAHDNSAKKPSNPDPAKRIRFGPQSWDEMFIGFVNVAEVPSEAAARKLAQTPSEPGP